MWSGVSVCVQSSPKVSCSCDLHWTCNSLCCDSWMFVCVYVTLNKSLHGIYLDGTVKTGLTLYSFPLFISYLCMCVCVCLFWHPALNCPYTFKWRQHGTFHSVYCTNVVLVHQAQIHVCADALQWFGEFVTWIRAHCVKVGLTLRALLSQMCDNCLESNLSHWPKVII